MCHEENRELPREPIVSVNSESTYAFCFAGRRQTRYTPATEPFVLIERVIEEDDTNVEFTLTTADGYGVPAHDEALVITNACESDANVLTKPTPASVTSCAVLVDDKTTLGVSEVAEKMSRGPTAKYGDTVVHRAHRV